MDVALSHVPIIPCGPRVGTYRISEGLEATHYQTLVTSVNESRYPGRGTFHDGVRAATCPIAQVNMRDANQVGRVGTESKAGIEPIELDTRVEYRRSAKIPNM